MLPLKDPSLLKNSCYLEGSWINADHNGTIGVTNPATGENIGTVPKMGAPETRRAIAAASIALPAWRAKTAKERSAILKRWFDLIMANQDDLAVIMTAEQGKPLAEAGLYVVIVGQLLVTLGGQGQRKDYQQCISHGIND